MEGCVYFRSTYGERSKAVRSTRKKLPRDAPYTVRLSKAAPVGYAVRLNDREDENPETGGDEAEEPDHKDRQFAVVGEKTSQFFQVAGEHHDAT